MRDDVCKLCVQHDVHELCDARQLSGVVGDLLLVASGRVVQEHTDPRADKVADEIAHEIANQVTDSVTYKIPHETADAVPNAEPVWQRLYNVRQSA